MFSFGAVLYELLAGRQPFAGATELEVLQKLRHQEAESPGDEIPRAPRMVVEKAIEKDPAERYQTMRDLVVDLRRLARQTVETRAPASRSSRRWIAMAATALVIIALGVGALWRTRPTSTNAPRIRSLAVLPLQNLSHVDHALQRHDQDGAGDRPRAGRGRDPRRLGATSGRERPHYGATDSRVKAEVARTIAQEIQAHLTPEETRRLASARSIRPDAHEAFLLGRYHYLKSSEAELRQAVDYFERAIRLQPDYAAAYAGLSLHGRSSVHSKHSSRIS